MNKKVSRSQMVTAVLNVAMPYEGDEASITVTTDLQEGQYPSTGLTLDRELYRDEDIATVVEAIFEAAQLHENDNPKILKALREVAEKYEADPTEEEAPQVVNGLDGRLKESFGCAEVVPTNVVAAVVMTSDEKYLLVQSAKDNLWEFPGGKMEEGEMRFDTAFRELQEELGLGSEFKYSLRRSEGRARYDQKISGNGYEINLKFVFFETNLSSSYLSEKIVVSKREIKDVYFIPKNQLPDFRNLMRESNLKAYDDISE